MKTSTTYLKICLFLQGLEEIVLLQMSIWKHLADLDVQAQHSLCFYPKTDQIGKEPGVQKKRHVHPTENQKRYRILTIKCNQSYLSSIMSNCKICTGQFWFDEPFVFSKCLVQLLRKCFVRRLWKHTGKQGTKVSYNWSTMQQTSESHLLSGK